MPERWQQEVRKLGDLQPSDDVWRRAEQGPREPDGPSLPPRRQRVVAGVVAFVIFLAAGGFAWRALRPTDSDLGGPTPSASTIVATFRVVRGTQGGSGPSGTLTTSEGVIAGKTSSFQWASGNSVGNADVFGPPVTDKDTFVPIAAGTELFVVSDAEGVTGSLDTLGNTDTGGSEPLFEYPQFVSFGQIAGPVALDQPPGRYVLHLVPAWDEGTVNYYFPIELTAPKPAAVLSFVGRNAPEALLDWGDTDQQGVRGEYSWCGADGCVTGIPEFASYPPVHRFLPVIMGTPLGIEGDAAALRGTFSTVENEDVSSLTLDTPGAVPDQPGRYVLRVDVELAGAGGHHGRATFFFGIEVTSDVMGGSPWMRLAGSSWQLVSVDGVTIPATIDSFTLSFTADRLGGNDGCNGFGSAYEIVGNSIHLRGGWSSTAALCTGTVSYQHPLMAALNSDNTFERSANRLTITSPSTAMVFEPAYRI